MNEQLISQVGVVIGGLILLFIGFRMMRYSMTNAADMLKSLLLNLLALIIMCGICGGVAYFVFTQQ